MITTFLLLLINPTYTSSSLPLSYLTLSNPAFTAYYGRFHVYIEPRDVGDISVFSCSGKIDRWALGFSNIRLENDPWYERRNWASIAHHFAKLPLSVGINTGIYKIFNETYILTDVGFWLKRPVSTGLIFANVFNDNRIIRGGISYPWQYFTFTIEMEDSLQTSTLVPHGMITFTYPVKDFSFYVTGGFYPNTISGGIGIEYRRFVSAQLLYEDVDQNSLKALIGIHFRPPIVFREIAVVETMTVKQPVIIEKTVIKKDPPKQPQVSPDLTAQQLAYCEEHYMKGIELYVSDELDKAIQEWILVTKVDPDYKDVERYLDNARAKKELLEEE